jgi:hypothetical protein
MTTNKRDDPVGDRAAAVRRNAAYLARYIRMAHPKPIDLYAGVLTDRLLPALSDDEILKEADRIESQAFERLGERVAPEDYDPADFVDDARDEAVEYLLNVQDARQGVINTFAAGLYHRFEQQLSKFFRIVIWGLFLSLTHRRSTSAPPQSRRHPRLSGTLPHFNYSKNLQLRTLAGCGKTSIPDSESIYR